jgi:hypothetical protein
MQMKKASRTKDAYAGLEGVVGIVIGKESLL